MVAYKPMMRCRECGELTEIQPGSDKPAEHQHPTFGEVCSGTQRAGEKVDVKVDVKVSE